MQIQKDFRKKLKVSEEASHRGTNSKYPADIKKENQIQ